MFTVLMSVYWREQPQALSAALESLVSQTVMPEEILLIKDGPLGPELEDVVDRYRGLLPLRTHALPMNQGLVAALNEGLRLATQPWIMRFDSDDICLPERTQLQMDIARTDRYALFGGQIKEFDVDPEKARRSRSVPRTHDEIKRYGLRRNPFNHMTVCYRKDLAIALGGYPPIPHMEDYGLWTLMLASGATTANSSETLVLARVGNGMLKRRGGIRYAKSEWKLQEHMVSLGLKSRFAAMRDGTARSLVFLSPRWIRAWVYGRWLRTKV